MTDDLESNDQPPRRWLDAFPWLRGASSKQAETPWWEGAIDDAGPDERKRRLAQISELAMRRLTRWTVGQIYPGLPADLILATLDLPTRALNALERGGYLTAGQLTGLTLDEIIDWRQVGVGTVDAILRALADVSTTLPIPAIAHATVPERAHAGFSSEESHQPEWLVSLIDDLSQVAAWQTAIGRPEEPLLGSSLPPGTPDDVLKARIRLGDLAANDILDEREIEMDAAGLLDNALQALDERALQVMEQRLFADEPATLDQLGKQFDVSRERIRQIEGKARAAMLDAISDGLLNKVASTARNLIGTVRALSDLLHLMPALSQTVKTVGQPAWRVIDRLDDAYEIEEGWGVVPTLSAAQDWTSTQLRERADRYGVVRLDELNLVETSSVEQAAELTKKWLLTCGYIVDGAYVLTRTQSVGDYAASILSITGSPMSSQEIVDRFAFERSTGSLKNAMGNDDRFERVDRDRWALTEWGMDAYAGVRSVIRREVATAGGRITLDALVERVTGKYSVSASSVITYASAPPFDTREGIVRVAEGSGEVRKAPERTSRLFSWADAWAYRVRVTHDHLRGSGSMAPMAIASILDLQYGDKRQLDSDLGPQSVNWSGTQPAFGTIRRFLLKDDVAADTDVFLVIRDDNTFSVEIADEPSGDPLADALALIGAPRELGAERARLAFAAAIKMPTDSPAISIIGKYRERGDSDIADLLVSVRHHLETSEPTELTTPTANVDDILDLL
ncbi:sigma factor-like helix-turn-helix DNA-binding protein [Haloechinothrix halophila]|uniref:sigma factor-like helix-turn-helix DNA-binding protein n=1 Tax=Haloechinothrix halophila TaxID=1069073 RepID=UPI000420BD18